MTDLMDQQSWVVQGLGAGTLRVTEDFGNLTSKRIESGMIGRLEDFWEGTGTKERIRRFMSENTWIWYSFMAHETFKIMLDGKMFD